MSCHTAEAIVDTCDKANYRANKAFVAGFTPAVADEVSSVEGPGAIGFFDNRVNMSV